MELVLLCPVRGRPVGDVCFLRRLLIVHPHHWDRLDAVALGDHNFVRQLRGNVMKVHLRHWVFDPIHKAKEERSRAIQIQPLLLITVIIWLRIRLVLLLCKEPRLDRFLPLKVKGIDFNSFYDSAGCLGFHESRFEISDRLFL